MKKLEGKDSGIRPVFQDMELAHKGKSTVEGPAIEVNPNYRVKLEHPNEADVTMTRLIDRNGKPEYSS